MEKLLCNGFTLLPRFLVRFSLFRSSFHFWQPIASTCHYSSGSFSRTMSRLSSPWMSSCRHWWCGYLFFLKGRRRGMRNLWLYVVCNLAVGVSLALPLFLFFRERKLN